MFYSADIEHNRGQEEKQWWHAHCVTSSDLLKCCTSYNHQLHRKTTKTTNNFVYRHLRHSMKSCSFS